MKKYAFLLVPLGAVLAASLLLFTTLDWKVFDLFLRALPPLRESPSVLLVNIDDVSIEKVGIWPWTRDIMADAVVFLREIGAETVVSDLSYLDASPMGIDSEYLQTSIPAKLDAEFAGIDDTVSQVLDAFADGRLKARDAEDMKRGILEYNGTARAEIEKSVAFVARDLDEYFAGTLRLFGDSWLTLTMITPDDIVGDDKSFDMTPYDPQWLQERLALKGAAVDGDTLTPDNPGMTPAIRKLLESARGAGFVNALSDPDGYRRRIRLVMKQGGVYYGQLAFMPLLERLGNPRVEITNRAITLRGATLDGKAQDIEIPRTTDGSTLIHWPAKPFSSYNSISAWKLISYGLIESSLAKDMRTLEENGFFGFWGTNPTPLALHDEAAALREKAVATGDQDATREWADKRAEFFGAASRFASEGYETEILSAVAEDDEATRSYVKANLATVRAEFAEMSAIRDEVAAKAKGALCILGMTATSTTDVGLTTYQEDFPNVGVHATLANMILSRDFLDDAPPAVSVVIALLVSGLLAFAIKRFDTRASMYSGFGAMAATVLLLLLYFRVTRRYVGVTVPLASTGITFLTLTGINFFTTLREKSFLRSAFSRYLSPEVISEIINDPSKLNLGGEKREMTAIFTDLQGFSGISEKMDPADLVNLLNRYLTAMSNIILENRGTIDKYEGDAIIAFFGAPIRTEDHAALACRSAIRMKRLEADLNRAIMAENLSPEPLFTRIGMNTGDMIVGNMGTPNKMDYTIMGNAVNLASRLEGVNKQYGTGGILISESTQKSIGDGFLTRRLDRVRVVGVRTPLRLYELLDLRENATEETVERAAKWEKAMDLFEKRDYPGARALFEGFPETDRCAALYAGRCREYENAPPKADWDGVFNLSQK